MRSPLKIIQSVSRNLKCNWVAALAAGRAVASFTILPIYKTGPKTKSQSPPTIVCTEWDSSNVPVLVYELKVTILPLVQPGSLLSSHLLAGFCTHLRIRTRTKENKEVKERKHSRTFPKQPSCLPASPASQAPPPWLSSLYYTVTVIFQAEMAYFLLWQHLFRAPLVARWHCAFPGVSQYFVHVFFAILLKII